MFYFSGYICLYNSSIILSYAALHFSGLTLSPYQQKVTRVVILYSSRMRNEQKWIYNHRPSQIGPIWFNKTWKQSLQHSEVTLVNP